MKFEFCPLCGEKLIDKYSWDEGYIPYCEKHDMMFFDTPKPCVVVAVIKGNEVLLLKQSYIFKNSKVLVSGYVGQNEKVEDTVEREVREEAGIEVENIRYLGSDFIENKEILMITYVADYKSGEIKKSAEVEDVMWIPINEALSHMKENRIGKNIIKKILNNKQQTGTY
ncbi:NAD(+) diphosphatase [Oceanirhabdus sp. W0125-5]|uniref:NAD(+) diphosphatase n=1 Tax=Oceanirhabdus sp. W0125-5 TaxID=2999116 RepID=UPI0022F2C5BD|nr:NUDIX domain-containing protein [Oceanirhabdus sp. W0125-5]WBW97552.1 NUDIX domain-containing protein [Oceanirhabdus sp. W0125-5]